MPNSKAILRILLITICIFIFLFVPNTSYAQNILLSDDFESGISANWHIIHGYWYTALDENYPSHGRWLVANAPRSSDYEIQAGDFSWTNYQLSFDILPKTGMGIDRNIFFRVNNMRTNILTGHDLPVSYSLQLTQGLSYLWKWTLITESALPSSSFSIPLNVISHVVIKLYDSNIEIIINGSQILKYTDINNPILNGRIALATITGADAAQVWYDNVLITDLPTATSSPTATPFSTPTLTPSSLPTFSPTPTPTPTRTPTPRPSSTPSPTPTLTPTPPPYPTLNVLDLKQYDPRWNSQIYDTATKWSTYPTIERWGCALTSATMILNYYNHLILPDNLNKWLINQPDGYLSNGLINWLAITRYSKLTSSLTAPILEFRRADNDPNKLLDELNNQRPTILEVPGHFVVAKSKTAESFGINDPAYSNRPNLLSYSNTFKSMRNFTPTHTDLSYLLLTIDQIFNLTVIAPDGNIIDTNTYIDHPLVDDLDGLSYSGGPLKIFELPKPEFGEYTVEVKGNGSYNLTSYLYNKDGNLTKNIINHNLKNGTSDIFVANIGVINFFGNKVSLSTLYTDLDDYYNRGYINPLVYLQIKSELKSVEELLHLNKYDLAKKALIIIKKEIKLVTPLFVRTEASKILVNDIDLILKSF